MFSSRIIKFKQIKVSFHSLNFINNLGLLLGRLRPICIILLILAYMLKYIFPNQAPAHSTQEPSTKSTNSSPISEDWLELSSPGCFCCGLIMNILSWGNLAGDFTKVIMIAVLTSFNSLSSGVTGYLRNVYRILHDFQK